MWAAACTTSQRPSGSAAPLNRQAPPPESEQAGQQASAARTWVGQISTEPAEPPCPYSGQSKKSKPPKTAGSRQGPLSVVRCGRVVERGRQGCESCTAPLQCCQQRLPHPHPSRWLPALHTAHCTRPPLACATSRCPVSSVGREAERERSQGCHWRVASRHCQAPSRSTQSSSSSPWCGGRAERGEELGGEEERESARGSSGACMSRAAGDDTARQQGVTAGQANLVHGGQAAGGARHGGPAAHGRHRKGGGAGVQALGSRLGLQGRGAGAISRQRDWQGRQATREPRAGTVRGGSCSMAAAPRAASRRPHSQPPSQAGSPARAVAHLLGDRILGARLPGLGVLAPAEVGARDADAGVDLGRIALERDEARQDAAAGGREGCGGRRAQAAAPGCARHACSPVLRRPLSAPPRPT